MLALLALHVHPTGAYADVRCYQCDNHLPHPGHLSTAYNVMHDCVLCQIQGETFVPAVVVALMVILPVMLVHYACYAESVLSGRRLIRSTRAPPCFRN